MAQRCDFDDSVQYFDTARFSVRRSRAHWNFIVTDKHPVLSGHDKDVREARAETAKDLAYRLYVICDRKVWSQEALAYNMLVKSWPELQKLAAGSAGESARLL